MGAVGDAQWDGVSACSDADFAAAAAALRRGAARGAGLVQLGPLRLLPQACLGQGAFATVLQACLSTNAMPCMSLQGCLLLNNPSLLEASAHVYWADMLNVFFGVHHALGSTPSTSPVFKHV